MKNLALFYSFLLLILFSSCAKKAEIKPNILCNCVYPPSPVLFAILDTNGKSVLKSSNDRIYLSYIEKDIERIVPSYAFALSRYITDTVILKKYNDAAISADIGLYAIKKDAPIRNFHLRINQTEIGEIYFEYVKERGYFMPIFELNGIQAEIDSNVVSSFNVLHLK